MKLPKAKKMSAAIPTASTADIAFLLIIFFMATTKFDAKNGLGLVLPPPAQENAIKVKLADKNLTKVSVNAQGQIAINEKIVTFSSIEGIVRSLIRSNPKMVMAIKVDRDAAYNDMVQVLDQLRKAGAEKITLQTN